ncbi:MAG TPA: hypothetical protein VI298_02745 [Geobacteraceae bacterium]
MRYVFEDICNGTLSVKLAATLQSQRVKLGGFLKIFSTVLGMILGLAFLTALLTGGYFLFKYIVSVFDTLGPQVGTLAAIASVVAVLCAVIIAGGLARCTNEGASVAKAQVYERLAALLADQLGKEKFYEDDRAATSELVKLEQSLALHGSSKVIASYMQLRLAMGEGGKEGSEGLELLNKFVLAMRADIGRREMNIKEKDISALLMGRS